MKKEQYSLFFMTQPVRMFLYDYCYSDITHNFIRMPRKEGVITTINDALNMSQFISRSGVSTPYVATFYLFLTLLSGWHCGQKTLAR